MSKTLTQQRRREKNTGILPGILLTLYCAIIIFPLIYIVQLTFSGASDTTFRIFPRQLTLRHYQFVFSAGLILKPFINSIILTFSGTSVAVVLTVLFAYPLSRKELVGRRILNFIVILPMMLNLGFLPRYLLVKDLGLLNTYTAIILVSALTAFNTILIRNYFQNLPLSLIESGRIDGASEFRILTQLVIPISMPVIATVALFAMMSMWNQYFTVILYIGDTTRHTLQVILRSMIINEDMASSSTDDTTMFTENIQYTTIVIAMIPIMIVYPFLQKYFVKGIMLGSVKG